MSFLKTVIFLLIYKDERLNLQTKRKFLKDIRKNQFLKVNNSLLELGKDFIELKDKELEVREVKIKRKIEELLFKPILNWL